MKSRPTVDQYEADIPPRCECRPGCNPGDEICKARSVALPEQELMRELHLFAGCGGGILAGKLLGHRCVGAVEIDPYCRKVLAARQADGCLEAFPILDDVTTFDGTAWRGQVDVVCGGFPCQNVSDAGNRQGLDGKDSALWFEMARVIRDVEPEFAFVENVPGLLSRGMDRVLGSLAELGFDAEWTVLSAADLGARHERARVWILAAHPDRKGLAQRQGQRENPCTQREAAIRSDRWPSEPDVVRVVDGLPRVLDRRSRVSALGRAQVPALAAVAFRILMERVA